MFTIGRFIGELKRLETELGPQPVGLLHGETLLVGAASRRRGRRALALVFALCLLGPSPVEIVLLVIVVAGGFKSWRIQRFKNILY